MLGRAVNPSDLLAVRGVYRHRIALPATAGYEGMGVVVEGGETALAPGSRVALVGVSGAWQEYVQVPEEACVPVPTRVSDRVASQFSINFLSAWLILTEQLTLGPGEFVVINAAGSTVAKALIQISRRIGAKVIAVTGDRARRRELLDLGACAVVDASRDEVISAVTDATGGEGASVALDAVGGRAGSELVRCVRSGGTLLYYGLLSGQPLAVDVGRLTARAIDVRGFWLRRWLHETPGASRRAVAARAMEFVAAHQIELPVERSFTLGAVREAVDLAARRGRLGKVLLVG